MVPPPATVAPETSYVRALGQMERTAGSSLMPENLAMVCANRDREQIFIDTVEVCGSSPHGPTISFSELASTTSLGKAPTGSIKEAVRNYRAHFLSILRQDTCTPAGLLTGNVLGTHQSRRFRISNIRSRSRDLAASSGSKPTFRGERSPKSVRLSLHACGRRQMKRMRLPRELDACPNRDRQFKSSPRNHPNLRY